MEKTQHTIREKIGSLHIGLLRYNCKGEKISLPAHITVEEGNVLNCVCTDFECLGNKKLLNKNITLVQRDDDNYLYIGGRVHREVRKNKLELTIYVTKACWFIRKSRGSVTWLQEKLVYMPKMNIAS
jgi:hypothetical protein